MGVKTMHDVRTMRSIAARMAAMPEDKILLQLHRLAAEKLRIGREADLWLRKKAQVEHRLREIEEQMASLRQLSPRAASESLVSKPQTTWQQVTIEY